MRSPWRIIALRRYLVPGSRGDDGREIDRKVNEQEDVGIARGVEQGLIDGNVFPFFRCLHIADAIEVQHTHQGSEREGFVLEHRHHPSRGNRCPQHCWNF